VQDAQTKEHHDGYDKINAFIFPLMFFIVCNNIFVIYTINSLSIMIVSLLIFQFANTTLEYFLRQAENILIFRLLNGESFSSSQKKKIYNLEAQYHFLSRIASFSAVIVVPICMLLFNVSYNLNEKWSPYQYIVMLFVHLSINLCREIISSILIIMFNQNIIYVFRTESILHFSIKSLAYTGSDDDTFCNSALMMTSVNIKKAYVNEMNAWISSPNRKLQLFVWISIVTVSNMLIFFNFFPLLNYCVTRSKMNWYYQACFSE